MNRLQFVTELASVENDLNGVLMLMELSRQRDTPEVFQARVFPKVQNILKRLSQELSYLSDQEVTSEAEQEQGTTYRCSKCGYSFTIKPGQITTADVKTHCGLIMETAK